MSTKHRTNLIVNLQELRAENLAMLKICSVDISEADFTRLFQLFLSNCADIAFAEDMLEKFPA